ncbi:MAG: hydrogen gas-evolving membrane-bound hydrogenase subunit E [Candidatus Methylomirabilales bacterium]
MVHPVLILVLPFIAAGLTPVVARGLGRWTGWWAAAVAGLHFLWLLSYLPSVAAGTVLTFRYPWIPALGVNLTVTLDGLGLFFALLITGVGTLIFAYGRRYLGVDENHGKFFAFMLLFMGSMLGVVLTSNLLALFVFWELTSLSSFLLIGFWDHREASRYGATKALLVTGLGGLAMLLGFILLYSVTGSWELPVVLAQGETIRASGRYLPILGLIFLGCATKSAQFPFHIWLPNAMEAPTPVSAYLHSATMVKAGLYLIARLTPALAGTDAWVLLVGGVGLLTLVVGGFLAFAADDLKALLAYSTVSQLGLIMSLYGLGTVAGAQAASFHLMNHSAFKAALFLAVGIIEHESGTRRLSQLGGLFRYMPVTGTFATIAALAMAGLPPFGGFISKEMFYEGMAAAAWEGPGGILFPVLAVGGSIFTFLYAIRIIHGAFLGEAGHPPRHPHEAPLGLLWPVGLLAGANVLLGLWPAVVQDRLLAPMAEAISGAPVHPHLALWHGFNPPLLMSLVTVGLGCLLYPLWRAVGRWQERAWAKGSVDACYDWALTALPHHAGRFSAVLQSGQMSRYLSLILPFVMVLGFWGLWSLGASLEPVQLREILTYEGILLALIAVSSVGVVLAPRPLPAVIILGGAGYLVALFFIVLHAPDLALTQFLIETVSLVLFLLVLYRIPPYVPEGASAGVIIRDLVIATGVGLMVTLVLLASAGRFLFPSIAEYFLRESVPGGGGRNVVNVILIDFRGYDTLGEISVLAIALLGVYTLITMRRKQG